MHTATTISPIAPTQLEFGVAGGLTVNITAAYKRATCGTFSSPVYGFDTFTGLPEAWHGMPKGMFTKGGHFPLVEPNVVLQQGLFSDSLPPFLKELDKVGAKGQRNDAITNVTYLHIDCDLYTGAIQALTMLSDRISPGAVLIFDELFNCPEFREHEIKALWEWLSVSRRRLQVVGMKGPLPNMTNAVQLDDKPLDLGATFQSTSFIVM